jgi:hypothetical protein
MDFTPEAGPTFRRRRRISGPDSSRSTIWIEAQLRFGSRSGNAGYDLVLIDRLARPATTAVARTPAETIEARLPVE